MLIVCMYVYKCACRCIVVGGKCMFCLFYSSSGADALPNGLDVTFEVTELKRMTGSYNTMVGNNEGSMVCH